MFCLFVLFLRPCAGLLSAAGAAAPAGLWPTPVKTELDPDALGNVEVLLIPPTSTSRKVTAAIDEQDKLRELREHNFLAKLNEKFETERTQFLRTVGWTVRLWKLKNKEGSSFVETKDAVTQRLRVKVLPVRAIADKQDKVLKRIWQLGTVRAKAERKFIRIALREMRTVGNIYVKKLKELLPNAGNCQPAASFLQTPSLSPVINLRVGTRTGEIYPRIATQVWDMEKRRDVVEANVRDTILFLTSAILKAGNDQLHKALKDERAGVARFGISSFLEAPKQDKTKDKKKSGMSSIAELMIKFNMDIPRIMRKRLIDEGEIELDVHPPAESGAEVLTMIDAITKAEQEQIRIFDQAYADDKILALNEALFEMSSIVCNYNKSS